MASLVDGPATPAIPRGSRNRSQIVMGGDEPVGIRRNISTSRRVTEEIEPLLETLRRQLVARGTRSIIDLGRKFRSMDDDSGDSG